MIEKTFEVDGPPDIEVRIESGRVEVHRGESGSVTVTVDTKTPDFIVEQRGNSILVSSEQTMSWLSRSSAYVVIQTPEGSDLRVSVASADIRADVALEKANLKTASGDIELESAETLEVKSASGDLQIERVGRALSFSSASGDLLVPGVVSGSITISTASGDIYIDDADGNVAISTASGDTRLRRFTGRSATFKSMSGSVDIGIPRRTEVSLDANLLSGKLRLPDSEPTQEDSERQTSIRAKLVSGDLIIERL
ncbi:MAG TPA: DUF4097 family beta strand repeat-containing protein [Acidimicrobiia bacterium]